MNREHVLKILHADVKRARKRFQDAEEYLDLAIHRRMSHRSDDRRERIRWTSRSYRLAARDLRVALDRLQGMVSQGLVPEDLKLKPPRRPEQVQLNAARKSA